MYTLNHSKGAALVTALVLMVSLTMFALASMRGSTTQLTLSGNDEARVEAYERAQSIVDAVVDDDSYFVVAGQAGYSVCTSNISGCDKSTISLSGSPFTSSETDGIQARVMRLVPENMPMPRIAESSGDKFDTALFSISGEFDESKLGRGKAKVVQGYLMLVPKAGQ
jgi:hypothetical protein